MFEEQTAAGGGGDALPIRGQLGVDLSLADGQESARRVVLSLLPMGRAD